MNLKSGLAALVICILWFNLSMAQSDGLQLSARVIDFGRIASAIAYPAKTIEFTNHGSEKLAILLIEKGPNVKVNFERRFFQPGEKGVIFVYYEPKDPGEFNEEIWIYSNLDNLPQTVMLKGACVSVQECFPNIHNLLLRNVIVINKVTLAPVPLAELTLIRNHNVQNPVILKVDKNGKATEELPIGLYNANVKANGYEPYDEEFFLPKTQPNVVIQLTPKLVIRDFQPTSFPSISEDNSPAVASIELPENKYAANNIVLLLDVSTSMKGQGKFSLLQQSINNLVLVLRPIDFVSIITYATSAKVVLPGLPGNEKEKIMSIVQELVPVGSTQGVKGLNTAYEMATKRFIKNGNNQIILATDGEFSDRNLSDEYYQQFISDYARKGIKLSILGFGVNKTAIDRMKKMVTSGQGSYIHISSEQFVKDVLINEIKSMSFIK